MLLFLFYSIDSDGNCAGIVLGQTAEINVELTLVQCTQRIASGPLQWVELYTSIGKDEALSLFFSGQNSGTYTGIWINDDRGQWSLWLPMSSQCGKYFMYIWQHWILYVHCLSLRQWTARAVMEMEHLHVVYVNATQEGWLAIAIEIMQNGNNWLDLVKIVSVTILEWFLGAIPQQRARTFDNIAAVCHDIYTLSLLKEWIKQFGVLGSKQGPMCLWAVPMQKIWCTWALQIRIVTRWSGTFI